MNKKEMFGTAQEQRNAIVDKAERTIAGLLRHTEGNRTGIYVRKTPSFATDTPVFWIETEWGFYELEGGCIHEITEKSFRDKTMNVQELKTKPIEYY